jgi:hypothetical protein
MTLTVEEMKEAFDHLKKLISIMEECDLNAVRSLEVHRAVDRDTACYRLLYEERKKASVQLYLEQFFKEADMMLSTSTSSQHKNQPLTFC